MTELISHAFDGSDIHCKLCVTVSYNYIIIIIVLLDILSKNISDVKEIRENT